VLNSTLAFLLVFRLNRAASRFWVARRFWGDIVAKTRSLVSGVIVHGEHNRFYRDETIRWTAAFSIATMDFLRGEADIVFENYGGILSTQEVNTLIKQTHPPMYAADQIRFCLKRLFSVDVDASMSIAISRPQEMDTLEKQLNSMIWCGGGMERIKATPLPMVYVSHLRTFLILNLILFPWVFGPTWGWITIPIVAVSAFAWLGIECAALEVERPFFKNRVNSLNMDGYVLGLLSTIQQQITNHADYEIQQTGAKVSTPDVDEMASNPNAMQSDTKEY
jgi:putative membrane protein